MQIQLFWLKMTSELSKVAAGLSFQSWQLNTEILQAVLLILMEPLRI